MLLPVRKLFLAMMIPFAAGAAVNPVDQTLTENHADWEGHTLSVTRNFHSNRASSGMFGKGWCSLWETKLTPGDTTTEFNLCGDGNYVRFTKAQSWKAADPAYQLVNKGNGYEVVAGFRNRYHFDKTGRLTGAQLDDKNYAITYDGKNIKTIAAGTERVEFQFTNNKLASMKTSAGMVSYTFEGDYLKSVSSGGKVLYQYTHNKHGQLIEVTVSGRKREYTYSGKTIDRIKFGQCKEDIDVKAGKADRTVVVEKSCPSGTEKKTFTVTGTSRTTNLKLKTTRPTGITEREWKNGRLVTERGPAGLLKYEYDKYGAIKQMTMPGWNLVVNERASGYPRKVTIKSAGVAGNQAVQLNWQSGRLLAVNSKALSFQIKEGAHQTSFSGPDFDLTMTEKSGENMISGHVMKQKFAPFITGGDIGKMQPAQLDAMGLMTSLTFLKDRLESL